MTFPLGIAPILLGEWLLLFTIFHARFAGPNTVVFSAHFLKT